MSSKYRLCLICLLWLGCLFCLTSGFAGDFFFAWNGAFETLVSAEERLNDDPPALNQVVSGKNFSISAGASSEYSVPAKICRLAQTFGPGVDIQNDQRILPYSIRCAIQQENIVLKTKGQSERMLLYTMDAVSALLVILLRGENGQAYNAANVGTYSSIYETALEAAKLGEKPVQVVIEEGDAKQYPPDYYWNLNCTKLNCLGWNHSRTILEILERSRKA